MGHSWKWSPGDTASLLYYALGKLKKEAGLLQISSISLPAWPRSSEHYIVTGVCIFIFSGQWEVDLPWSFSPLETEAGCWAGRQPTSLHGVLLFLSAASEAQLMGVPRCGLQTALGGFMSSELMCPFLFGPTSGAQLEVEPWRQSLLIVLCFGRAEQGTRKQVNCLTALRGSPWLSVAVRRD